MVYQVAAAYEAGVGHADLTIISSFSVHTHQGKYYSNNSEYVCNGVDLSNTIHD